MIKATDLEVCKEIAKGLLYVDIEKPEGDSSFWPMILSHPFYNSCIVYDQSDGQIFSFVNDDGEVIEYNLHKANELILEQIKKAQNIYHLLMLINKPYRIFFFDMVREYLSDEDYGECLKIAWHDSEFPSSSPNFSPQDYVEMFKGCSKQSLMNEDELEVYKNLPNKIDIFRGESSGEYRMGMSWTLKKSKAEWFANRWSKDDGSDSDGIVYSATVDKSRILAYFESEEEVVLDPFVFEDGEAMLQICF